MQTLSHISLVRHGKQLVGKSRLFTGLHEAERIVSMLEMTVVRFLRMTASVLPLLHFLSKCRFGLGGKTIALNSEDKEKEVTFEANEVREYILTGVPN